MLLEFFTVLARHVGASRLLTFPPAPVPAVPVTA